ncbi:GNAT family N-acetyltransferase [Nocardioides sp. HDW12B]|uniref:GNAT family N-acetyltransferase n=1 Tax=Nocardioides sp. HDW12B TaxID=2714939 RepID=UPI001407D2F7|nr:GNAT family N-acetyltransferase [Nocardioides sp. HDW12B]QIK67749.1 GNAT family N-acetyltransferase [Nocardioides sp. HDW12B]
MPAATDPQVRLRPLTAADHDDVLALNAQEVHLLAPMDEARMAELHGWAHRFDVIEVDGAFGGFVIVIESGTTYDGDHYAFFTQTYEEFLYLDRVVLAGPARGRGVGHAVYDELEAEAGRLGRMTLEVNVDPPNPPSLAFHARRGYVEVGRSGPADHVVSLMAKEL